MYEFFGLKNFYKLHLHILFMWKKSGLSPVIATVLLVGLVVVSGVIMFAWFRGLTQEAVTKFDQNIQLVCKDVRFDVSYDDEELALSNIGNIPIYEFNVKVSGEGGYETKSIKELTDSGEWPADGLPQGGAVSVSVNFEGPSPDKIILTPTLVGTSQKGTQTSFTCDERLYGYQINLT